MPLINVIITIFSLRISLIKEHSTSISIEVYTCSKCGNIQSYCTILNWIMPVDFDMQAEITSIHFHLLCRLIKNVILTSKI